MNKRDFLKQTSSIALLSSLPVSYLHASSDDTLYEYLLQNAKRLGKYVKDGLTILYPEGSGDNVMVVAREFTEKTSIPIKLQQTSINDIATAMTLNKVSGQHKFDIALPASFSIPDLAEAEAIQDLTAFSNKYEIKDYTPSLYTYSDYYKTRKYGYLTDGDVYILFYNNLLMGNENYQKEYQDKFGQPLTIPQNWHEIDRLVKFFHRPQNDIYGGNLFRTYDYMAWEWWARFHATGQTVFDNDFQQNITGEHAIQALEDMMNINDYLTPESKMHSIFDSWKAFADGNIAVNIGWGGTQKYLNQNNSKVKDNLLFSAMPQVSYFNWGWNYVVSPLSPHKELSYIYCLFATLPEQSTYAVRAQNGFFDPFRKEHYDDALIQKAYTKPFLKTHKEAMKKTIPDFYMQGYTLYMKALKENILHVFEQNLSAREALELTAMEWDKITAKIGYKNQRTQWKNLNK